MPDKFLLTCRDCGQPFFTEGEKKFYKARHLSMPKRCQACRAVRKELQTTPYKQLKLNEVSIDFPERTLYIIGNGFDLMHGVPSSYYHFRDFLGRHSELRQALETWNLKEDLWADFEDSLAYMNDQGMLETLPDWMDNLGVLAEDDDDFSAADFFCAAELCISPLQIIQEELPKAFQKWVNTLTPRQSDRPLLALLHQEGRYINFNFTEFLETLYAIAQDHILYIHGSRRDKKQSLILGHAPDAGFDLSDCAQSSKPPYHDQTSFDLYETACDYVGNYYSATEKNSAEIIRSHQAYFAGLGNTQNIVVIGHSLSSVDYLYFAELIKYCPAAVWTISWHSAADLKRIKSFVHSLNIAPAHVVLFRT